MVKTLDIVAVGALAVGGYFLITKGGEALKSFTDTLAAPFSSLGGAGGFVFNLPSSIGGAVSNYYSSFQETPQQKAARLNTNSEKVTLTQQENAGFITSVNPAVTYDSASPTIKELPALADLLSQRQAGIIKLNQDTKTSSFMSGTSLKIPIGTPIKTPVKQLSTYAPPASSSINRGFNLSQNALNTLGSVGFFDVSAQNPNVIGLQVK